MVHIVLKGYKESEARYKSLFEASADGILIASVEKMKFIYANPSICKMLGYSEEELKVRGVNDIHPKDSIDHVISEFEAQGRGEKTLALDLPCLRKDGTIVYVDINTTTAVIDGKKCNIGFFRDITERKIVEKALHDSEQQYHTTIDSMSDAIHVLDNDLRIILTNGTFKQWMENLGLGNDITGLKIFEAFPFKTDKVMDEYNQVFKTGKTLITEESNKFGDREIITETRKIPIFEAKKVSRIITVIRDITERNKAEEKLKLTQKELEIKTKSLEEANTALKVLLKYQDEEKNIMEKTILTSLNNLVMPYLEKIEIGTSDERLKTYVNIIETNLSEITNPFANQLTGYYSKLTPTEVQIANLVRDNKTTKDISKILNISENAVFFHRKNIRNKLAIKNRKTNLRSFLQSLSNK
ncbi:MAG: PAS domain S-box protein [Candidatus Latescibacteria bacterium]|nr:PAS domain S-box protein [Candidatus Latescibacterota bacterium]